MKAVLLDVDGTLVNSNDQHAEAWVEALRQEGYEASIEQVRPLIGMGGDKLIPQLTGVSADSQ
ncbi:MAG TPA: HAD family hydrolase, partial [Polyangiales bacterium]